MQADGGPAMPAGRRQHADGLTRFDYLADRHRRSDRLIGAPKLASDADVADHDDSTARHQAGEGHHTRAGGADGNAISSGQVDSPMPGEPPRGWRVECPNYGERPVERRRPSAGLGPHR